MADDEDQRGREVEEGEIREGEELVPAAEAAGSDTDTDDEDARYYLQPHRGPAASSPASSDGSGAGFPCHVCGREFPSSKAVHGHMKVHAPPPLKEVAGASTGGGSGVEQVGDSVSVAIVVAATEPKVSDDTTTTPVRVQSVGSNDPAVNGGGSSARSSAEPIQSGVTVAATPPAPPQQAADAPAPEQEQVTVAATPPPPPSPPQQPTAAAAAAPQLATYIPLMVPAASQQQQPRGFEGPLHVVPRRDPAGRGFSCRECGRWFPTHQGLGGHVAGHKNRRLAAEAAAAGIEHVACRGGARAERSHACKVCGAKYPSGVSLGGHMRKHYNGKPIVPRKRMRLGPGEFSLALPLQRAPPAVEAPIAAPPVHVPAGCLRLFGVTIVQQQAKEEDADEDTEEEHTVGESTTTTTKDQ